MKILNNETLNNLRERVQQAAKSGDTEAFASAFDELMQLHADIIKEDAKNQIDAMRQEMDDAILANRGVRQLTSEERKYYQKLGEAMKSENPRQAIENMDVVLPETVINSVFEDLETNHPLLSQIDFIPSGGAISLLMNTNGYQEAVWGELCDEIVKELTSGFKEVNTVLYKLSAFIPVCKAMLELGPVWLDRYIRTILFEAIANGMEAGIVDGTGKNMPIGMTRQVGDGVSVTGGEYPKKNAIAVNEFTPATVGGLIAQLAKTPNGNTRPVNNVILVVNPEDYFTKVMPATTLQSPDGTYRNDVLPYPMTIIQSPGVDVGEAVIGLGKRYFAAAGINKGGRIEFSDHAKFLEDKRVYICKTYANGMPKDNNAFLLLNISGLKPAVWKVQQVTE